MQKLGDILSERALATFAGRTPELESLLHWARAASGKSRGPL